MERREILTGIFAPWPRHDYLAERGVGSHLEPSGSVGLLGNQVEILGQARATSNQRAAEAVREPICSR
jgi:hypothetical protein